MYKNNENYVPLAKKSHLKYSCSIYSSTVTIQEYLNI